MSCAAPADPLCGRPHEPGRAALRPVPLKDPIMTIHHAVVWLDHREARIFFIARDASTEVDVTSRKPDTHLHHHAGSISGKRTEADHSFLTSVVEILKPAEQWLVLGPGVAKLEFVRHVERHHRALAEHIVAVETVDHPSNRQIVAYARAHFHQKAPRIAHR